MTSDPTGQPSNRCNFWESSFHCTRVVDHRGLHYYDTPFEQANLPRPDDCVTEPIDWTIAPMVDAAQANPSVVTGSGRLTDTTDPTDVYEAQQEQLRVTALRRRCPTCDRAPGHYCAGNGMHMMRVYAESDELTAQLAAARRTEAETKAAVLDEVERIVKFEAGPGDVYMRADVLSVISQVRAASLLAQPETPELLTTRPEARHDLRATAAADMCPQCHGDNSDPWGLCAACSALVLPEESTTELNRANPKQES